MDEETEMVAIRLDVVVAVVNLAFQSCYASRGLADVQVLAHEFAGSDWVVDLNCPFLD